MRDYTHIDRYLNRIEADIYPQPQDAGHTALAREAILALKEFTPDVESVLDLGCGEGFCQPYFEELGYEYTGICLQRDFYNAKEKGRNVFAIDFSFLPFENSSYDLLFSRHSLEHSPFPLLTLMEWNRVCKKHLVIVLPAPEYWGNTGRNHYFVLQRNQWVALFEVAGFSVVFSGDKSMVMIENGNKELIEYWFVLERKCE